MSLSPNPVKFDPFGKTVDQVMSSRNVDCIHYNGCLDKAFFKNWKGFSCKDCKINAREDFLGSRLDESHSDHEWKNVYLQT
jgi:hypothetical protein